MVDISTVASAVGTSMQDRYSIALALLWKWLNSLYLEKKKSINGLLVKIIDYDVDLTYSEENEFTEPIPGVDYENKMADRVDGMSEQELLNMMVCKRLRMLRDFAN
ncbi:1126_t:CDS:2 [Acaulospora morrowiae]|uniref:1126_t:CDS:1 n=1 Tax=Acaulospora morrowiae TaxID=94023 RepID=A0A9N8ZV68_9GLOM|nr:1126_t:CDS:2 [Acaulospora morrowiae]